MRSRSNHAARAATAAGSVRFQPVSAGGDGSERDAAAAGGGGGGGGGGCGGGVAASKSGVVGCLYGAAASSLRMLV